MLQPDDDRTTDRSDSAAQEAAPAVDRAAGDRLGLHRRDHGALPAGLVLPKASKLSIAGGEPAKSLGEAERLRSCRRRAS